jgi:hypothetical protein
LLSHFEELQDLLMSEWFRRAAQLSYCTLTTIGESRTVKDGPGRLSQLLMKVGMALHVGVCVYLPVTVRGGGTEGIE